MTDQDVPPAQLILHNGRYTIVHPSWKEVVTIVLNQKDPLIIRGDQHSSLPIHSPCLVTIEVLIRMTGVPEQISCKHFPAILNDGMHGSCLVVFTKEGSPWTLNMEGFLIPLWGFPYHQEATPFIVPLDDPSIPLIFSEPSQ